MSEGIRIKRDFGLSATLRSVVNGFIFEPVEIKPLILGVPELFDRRAH